MHYIVAIQVVSIELMEFDLNLFEYYWTKYEN